jgi:5-methylcytosine-specific restriction protein A
MNKASPEKDVSVIRSCLICFQFSLVGKNIGGIKMGNEKWTLEELTASVDAYLMMLAHEHNGEAYNKSEYRKRLLNGILSGRSYGSYEYRMQNISAVLSDLGLKFINGYKPAKNVGTTVSSALKRLVQDKLDITNDDFSPTEDECLLES